MKVKVLNLFTIVILTLAWWRVARRIFGVLSIYRLIELTIIGYLCVAIVAHVAKKGSQTIWPFIAGLAILVVLVVPDTMVQELSTRLPFPFEDPVTLAILLVLPVAWLVSTLLLYTGLNFFKKWQYSKREADEVSQAQRKYLQRASLAAFVLSALVLAKALHSFYWAMVWDTTGDSLGNLWLPFPILLVLTFGALLISILPGKAKLAGLAYLLLIPILIVVATPAQRVDFRQLTNIRAERVRQAIEAYYAREGNYPQSLQQLIPMYIISLRRPVIIYGQGWCYQGGEDYYRLGFLDREHWSSPILFGRVYSAKGHSSLRVDVCQTVIDAYRAQHPDWEKVLQDYGKPTPTPDLGE